MSRELTPKDIKDIEDACKQSLANFGAPQTIYISNEMLIDVPITMTQVQNYYYGINVEVNGCEGRVCFEAAKAFANIQLDAKPYEP